jgi:chloramphenicol 3-O phosphotransferase
MRPALLVFCYVVAVAWVLPRPLRRLSEPGASPRLALAAWLTAMVSVLALAMAALGLLARTAVAGWPAFARTVCESVSAETCSPAVYRSAAYELGLAAVAFLGGVTMIVLGWRYGRNLRRASVRTRAHAEAARITGRPVEGRDPAFVLDAEQPAAYCVAGRPPTIVLTTGALAVLDPDQLTAVLAHERAHLAGRHHLLLAVTRALAAVAPAVPLFTRGTDEVGRLAEMRADDVAVRHAGGEPSDERGYEQGRRTLLAALLAMGTGVAVAQGPASWLAATGGVVAARVRRLAEPPAPGRWMGHSLALAGLTVAIVAASALVLMVALTGISLPRAGERTLYRGAVTTAVIVLNGGSSSGKSGIARCLQAVLPDPWLAFGTDTLVQAMPVPPPGIEFAPGGEVIVGPEFRRLEAAWIAGIAAMARAGARIIIDEVFVGGAASQQRWQDALDPLPVLWVGVRCDRAVAVAREIARGDRVAGMAASQADVVHQGIVYDLQVDTTHTEALDCARAIAARVRPP